MSTYITASLTVAGPSEMVRAFEALALEDEASANIPAEEFKCEEIADTGPYRKIRLSSSLSRYHPALASLLEDPESLNVARHLVVHSALVFECDRVSSCTFVNGELAVRDSRDEVNVQVLYNLDGTLVEGEVPFVSSAERIFGEHCERMGLPV